MTEAEARALLNEALAFLGIERGDTVYLGVDMARVPLPSYSAPLDRAVIRAREVRWCEFLLNVLMDAIRVEGTLLAPTFSYAYAREGIPYYHETSPAETGPFTEYLRTRPGVVRSFHPLNSISGLGPNAHAILDDVGRAGYGPLSPFARLSTYQTKFLSLGVPFGVSLTHAHHLEHMYGVNHMYHKVYTVPAYRDRKPDPGPWLCFVRYLGVGIEPRIGHLENQLRAVGVLKETCVLSYVMQCVAVMDVEQVGYAMLKENPCAFLTEPVEVHVEAPGAAPQVPSARAVHVSLRL